MRIGFAVCAALAAAACSQAPNGQNGAAAQSATAAAIAPIKIDNSTPDRALKTLWAMQDAELKARCELMSQLYADKTPEGRKRYRLILGYGDRTGLVTGNVQKEFDYLEPCDGVTPTLTREINEIKTETESRAVAFVTVKNITPIPSGAPDDKWAAERREKGDQYKIVLTKIDGGWLVEAVYASILNDGTWYQQFEKPGPGIPYDTAAF